MTFLRCLDNWRNQGVLTSVRRLFAFFEVDECNGDFATTIITVFGEPHPIRQEACPHASRSPRSRCPFRSGSMPVRL